MYLPRSLFALFFILSARCAVSTTPAPRSYATHNYYVLEHDSSSPVSLSHCAEALDVDIVEQVGSIRDHWLVRTPKPLDGLAVRSDEVERDEVVERLKALKRSARQRSGDLSSRSQEAHEARSIAKAVRSLQRQIPRQRTKRIEPSFPVERQSQPPLLRPEANVTTAADVANFLHIADPIFATEQWHLVNERFPSNTLNVTGVWYMGYTGTGVRVAVVDDGLDMDSDDLAANYDPEGSWDFNDHVPEPKPRLSDDRHGTRCSGEIAAVRNDVCGVGVAYDSKISGIRILSGPISDADEAMSLNYAFEETSIYSCSWGPPDDGRSMEAPMDLVQKALINGVQNGRGGLGSIYVFATGNGFANEDQCNFDGYTNSIFSITVGAVDIHGLHPYYSEACAANLVVTYSSGGGENIHTTDVGKNRCTGGHGGTSAAAPLVAGIMALALQARPELTWRDAQHVLVNTGVQINPNDPDWEFTAAGRPYSYKYGYGLIDAYAVVSRALTWDLVKPQAWVEVGEVDLPNAEMDWEGHMTGGIPIVPEGVSSTLTVTSAMLEENNFETMEHITIRVWINHKRRGDVQVSLLSPNGITSVLAGKRSHDEDPDGFRGWQFSSVKHWGENPIGDWLITVTDQQKPEINGSFLGWSMMLWGSVVDPTKAKQWELPTSVPPTDDDEEGGEGGEATATIPSTPGAVPSESRTKQLPKPTDQLPDDHADTTGEASMPAFTPPVIPSSSTDAPQPTDENDVAEPSSTSLPGLDEGYFDHMRNLLSNNYWLIGAFGVVILFVIGAGLYYWRRRVRRRRHLAKYTSVAGDDMPLGSLERGRSGRNGDAHRTKELYALGEAESDDEEGQDETAALTGHQDPTPGPTYHDDDDQDASAGRPRRYKDEPSDTEGTQTEVANGGPHGPQEGEVETDRPVDGPDAGGPPVDRLV